MLQSRNLFASNLLEKCNYHGFNSLDLKSSNFNTYFYNIDGNKSNFDTFISEIVPFDGKFSVIGIAETNISSDQKDLYNIDEYNSFYSDKIPDKSKGTGVAIYVHQGQKEIAACAESRFFTLFATNFMYSLMYSLLKIAVSRFLGKIIAIFFCP